MQGRGGGGRQRYPGRRASSPGPRSPPRKGSTDPRPAGGDGGGWSSYSREVGRGNRRDGGGGGGVRRSRALAQKALLHGRARAKGRVATRMRDQHAAGHTASRGTHSEQRDRMLKGGGRRGGQGRSPVARRSRHGESKRCRSRRGTQQSSGIYYYGARDAACPISTG